MIIELNFLVGSHVPQCGIIAVVDAFSALGQIKNIDHKDLIRTAVRVPIDGYRFLLDCKEAIFQKEIVIEWRKDGDFPRPPRGRNYAFCSSAPGCDAHHRMAHPGRGNVVLGLTAAGILVCAVAFLASLEELVITASSKKLCRDCKGLIAR
ncbi:MAG: hypothetical protein PHS97_04205 [Oscillospiraceae bacterium]|nr:hypothetical protein [Oscillospiraceae bacterium]